MYSNTNQHKTNTDRIIKGTNYYFLKTAMIFVSKMYAPNISLNYVAKNRVVQFILLKAVGAP